MGVLPDWAIERDVSITSFQKEQVSEGVISYGLSSYGYDIRAGYMFKVFNNVNCTVVNPKAFDQGGFKTFDLRRLGHSWEKHSTDMRTERTWRCVACRKEIPYTEKKDGEPILREECPVVQQPQNYVLIPPNSFCLAESVEYVKVPRDVVCVVANKSTYARCGIVCPITVLEPEWEGIITLEISNTTPLPAMVFAGEGIAQLLFFRSDGMREFHQKDLHHLIEKVNGRLDEKFAASVYRNFGTCRTSYADKKGRYNRQECLTLPFVNKELTNDDEPSVPPPLR